MSALLAYPVALAAAFPTTLGVLALWIAHARFVDGNRVDTVLLSFIFLFVTLIFVVSAVSNLAAVMLGQIAGAIAPASGGWVTITAAGVLVWCCCAWSQRGGLRQGPGPVSTVPVALFALADMLILAGGLAMLPGHHFS